LEEEKEEEPEEEKEGAESTKKFMEIKGKEWLAGYCKEVEDRH